MTSLIAIGAGIAALTGITWLCTCRRYCNFRYGCCNFNYLILRLRKGSGRECNY